MKDMIDGVPLTRAERLGKAHEHEQLMVAKYRTGELAEPGIERVPDNYHLWQEIIEYVDNEGNNRKRTHRDYPLPYTDDRYFRRFLELFLCRGAETGLTYKLSKEFTGDDVDSDYIEQLLITAEEYRLFEDDAAICFYGDNDYLIYRPSQYRPPQAGVFNSILNGVPMYDIIVGSEANKARAKMIRRWLKKRKKQLGTSWAAPRIIPAALATLSTAAAPAEAPKLNAQLDGVANKKPVAGTATGHCDPQDLDDCFSWRFKTSHCDRLAKMVDLCPPGQPFAAVGRPNTKIWAVVRAIKAGGYSAKTGAALAKLLGLRYGYTVAGKLTNVKTNAELENALGYLNDTIRNWKESKEIG